MKRIAVALLAALPLAACNIEVNQGPDGHGPGPFTDVGPLVAVLTPTAGNTAAGTVTFTKQAGGVRVVAEVTGLTPNAQHAIHVHEFGDLRSTDGASLGGHYNPEGHDHALPTTEQRHAGDLGNLSADDQGRASYQLVVDNMTLAGAENPILGRGVVVHAGTDDGGQPTGNAGGRIAVGVIGVAKP